MTKSIAFLGLGVMGGPMTANLAQAGYSVKAWNRTGDRPGVTIAREAGATVVSSLSEAVGSADIIFTCLGDVPDVQEVLLGEEGVIDRALPGSLVVDMSTIGSDAAISLGKSLESKGIRFLDAPVSGGDIGAQQGTLTIMVGGKVDDFQETYPFFQVMGRNIYHCGPVGSGQAVKMCNQVLAAVHMVALCEAMELAKVQNLDPNLIVEVCSTGAAGSWALGNLGPKIIASDWQPGFMIQHILKDLRLVSEIVAKQQQNLPGVKLANHLFQTAANLDNGQGSYWGTQGMMRAYRDQSDETNC